METLTCKTPGHEDKPQHGKTGLCQACYRRDKRLDRGLQKPGPKPDSTKPYSRYGGRLSHHGKRPACVSNHEFVEGSYKVRSDGTRICLICIEENRSTHCPSGHDYAVYAYIRSDGALNCKECIRLAMPVQRPKRYGITLDRVMEMLDEQDYQCRICHREFAEEGYLRYSTRP